MNKGFVYLPIVVMALIAFFLYIPQSPVASLSDREKVNIFLTSAITLFAMVEGYSTYMHVVLERDRNIIEDARNELEKAYGPLYTMLNKVSLFTLKLELTPAEKSNLDKIMATYPFMFPSEIYDLWRKEIQNVPPIVYTSTLTPAGYEILLEFRDKINEEYDRRVKRYNEILKKGKIEALAKHSSHCFYCF